jgi:hypothetical protein
MYCEFSNKIHVACRHFINILGDKLFRENANTGEVRANECVHFSEKRQVVF